MRSLFCFTRIAHSLPDNNRITLALVSVQMYVFVIQIGIFLSIDGTGRVTTTIPFSVAASWML
jgi:hypothetical protein